MQTTTHWLKSDLVAVARMMRDAGYEGFGHNGWGGYDSPGVPWDLSSWTKAQLVEAINNSEQSSTIFGHETVSVDKEPAQFRWVVKTPPPQNRTLLRIDWTNAYEWKQFLVGDNHPDLFAALECCLSAEPLTVEDRARLEAARPGITAMPMFLVDADAWEAEDEPEDEPEPPPPPPPRRKLGEKTPQWSKLSPKRKIRL